MTHRIYAVVLAAGHSTRFAGGKLTQLLDGKPLLQHSLAAAQRVFPGSVVLVTGHDSESIVESSAGLADTVVFNQDYASGQGSSLAAGVNACRSDADAVVVMLADQPLIDEDTLKRLTSHWNSNDEQVVVSDYGSAEGPPALFGRGCFDHLCALSGDAGAKSVIRSGRFDVATIDIGCRGLDVDAPEDLQVASQFLSAEK